MRDLSGVTGGIGAADLSPAGLARLAQVDVARCRWWRASASACPRSGIGKIVAIGLNYADHAAEAGMPLPARPIVFLKANSSLNGPDDAVMLPFGSVKSDWEVELGVVIGTTARNVARESALQHVAGYCVVNDVSEREFQIERGGTGTRGNATPSARSAPGWSPATKWPTRRRSACGWRSTASVCSGAAPPPWCSTWPRWSATSAAS